MTAPLSTALGGRLARALFQPPRKRHHRAPADFGLLSNERTVRTSDGIELHLWLIPGDGAGTVVVGHGIGLSKSASLRHAALLHELGHNVVMFDHRNHGLSGNDPARSDLSVRYSNDIEASLRVASETWPDAGAPVVWGFSFSTFPTLYSLRHDTTPAISAIICDSGPGFSLHDMLIDFLTNGGIPGPAALRWVTRRPAVAEAFAAHAVDMLGATWPPDPEQSTIARTPKLFLIGTHDRIIDPEQIRALARLYANTTIAELPVNHLRGITEAPQQYRAAVEDFLR